MAGMNILTPKGMALGTVATMVLALGGCGSEDNGGNHNTVDCDEETRDEEFVAGMSKTGEGGMTFALVAADPAPPARNDNAWTLMLSQDGTPIAGATIEVTPFMPDHNHGTPTVTQILPGLANGEYGLNPVNMFMPGLWEVTIQATKDDVTDEVVFRFCIPS